MSNLISYCNVDNVNQHVKRLESQGGFTSDSKVTKENVLSFIDQISRIVDGHLRSLGVSIPIPNTATISLGILKTLVSLEAASWAESEAFFGSNKKESTHAEKLHERYEKLLAAIQANPSGMLADVVTGNTSYMKSSTEDMNEGQPNHGAEIFTKEKIDDFRDDHKILSPSEEDSNTDIITGNIKQKI